MKQTERRNYLITKLLSEQPQYKDIAIPKDPTSQKKLLRSLMNIRMPKPIGADFLKIQDEYLKEETANKGVTALEDLSPIQPGIYLWRGDITTLKCDAIVNAANSGMTGCYCPCHGCIDNAIHTFSGIQLRLTCDDIMQKQGHSEGTGRAKITPAFNLPCRFVLHTVGPIITSGLTENDCRLLASCYRSCLELADENHLKSVAFCCISTGEFRFPREAAAQIAIDTVKEYKQHTGSDMEVIFNVYKKEDYDIYEKLLGTTQTFKD